MIKYQHHVFLGKKPRKKAPGAINSRFCFVSLTGLVVGKLFMGQNKFIFLALTVHQLPLCLENRKTQKPGFNISFSSIVFFSQEGVKWLRLRRRYGRSVFFYFAPSLRHRIPDRAAAGLSHRRRTGVRLFFIFRKAQTWYPAGVQETLFSIAHTQMYLFRRYT